MSRSQYCSSLKTWEKCIDVKISTSKQTVPMAKWNSCIRPHRWCLCNRTMCIHTSFVLWPNFSRVENNSIEWNPHYGIAPLDLIWLTHLYLGQRINPYEMRNFNSCIMVVGRGKNNKVSNMKFPCNVIRYLYLLGRFPRSHSTISLAARLSMAVWVWLSTHDAPKRTQYKMKQKKLSHCVHITLSSRAIKLLLVAFFL